MKRLQLTHYGVWATSLLLTSSALVPLAPAVAQGGAAPASQADSSYRVKAGDNLNILVFEKPELSRPLLIPPDGRITYPFLGEIKVSGLTLEEIRKTITKGLQRELNNPQVSVELSSRTKPEVSVLGAIRNAGSRTMEDGWHLLDLISAAGGLSTARTDLIRANLVRSDGAQVLPIDMEKLMLGDATQNVPLIPGDKLMITALDPALFSLTVLGETAKSGLIEVPKSGSFFELFTLIGGFKPNAAASRVRLTRKGQMVTLDMRQLMKQGTVTLVGDGKGVISAENLKAEPGDVLLIDVNDTHFTVLGGVSRPGQQIYPDSGKITLLEALTMTGNPVQGAELKKITVLRKPSEAGKPMEMIDVNLEPILKPGDPKKRKPSDKPDPKAPLVQDIALMPDDVVVVPAKQPGKPAFGLQNALQMLPFIGWLAR